MSMTSASIRCPTCGTFFAPTPGRGAACPRCGFVANDARNVGRRPGGSQVVVVTQAGPPGFPRQMAFDPGYAALGGPAPILVHAQPSWTRPGTVTTAAILGVVVGAIGLMGGLWRMSIRDLEFLLGSQARLFVDGMIGMMVGVALIIMGILAFSRNRMARWGLVGLACADAAFSMYLSLPRGGFWGPTVYEYLFVAIDIIIVTLMVQRDAKRYFETRNPLYG